MKKVPPAQDVSVGLECATYYPLEVCLTLGHRTRFGLRQFAELLSQETEFSRCFINGRLTWQ